MQYYIFLIVFGLGLRCVHSFWPPAYKVDLNDRKDFVIASDDTNYDDENENEMIQVANLAQFELFTDNEDKYKPLHSHVERYNKRAARTATEFAEAFPLFQPNLEEVHNLVEEAKPFVAGFKHELDKYDFDDLEEHVFKAMKRKRDISDSSPLTKELKLAAAQINELEKKNNFGKIYSEMNSVSKMELLSSVKMTIDSTEKFGSSTPKQDYSETKTSRTRKKRQIHDQEDQKSDTVTKHHESMTKMEDADTKRKNDNSKDQTSDEEDYNYHSFKAEYYEEMERTKNNNKTFNYTDNGEPEETAKDAVRKIIDFKMPKNCTQEELTQFGAKALECLTYDYQHAKDKKNVKKILTRTWTVLRVWVCIYLCIAIPCWCQKGWCCCCFRCAFCNPMDRIVVAKKYYAENPPGVLMEHTDGTKGEPKVTEFEPTLFELEAYEKFESAIRNL